MHHNMPIIPSSYKIIVMGIMMNLKKKQQIISLVDDSKLTFSVKIHRLNILQFLV